MRRVVFLAAALPVLALGIASMVSLPKKLLYSGSASAPIGFYWLDNKPSKLGDFVALQVPERLRELVEDRGYLPPDVPLIKQIAGGPGDEICRIGLEIRINGATIAMAQSVDGSGREMPVWSGCHVLPEGSVFLLQDHPQSFDGRYFGPVGRRLIIGRATRLRLHWRKREPS